LFDFVTGLHPEPGDEPDEAGASGAGDHPSKATGKNKKKEKEKENQLVTSRFFSMAVIADVWLSYAERVHQPQQQPSHPTSAHRFRSASLQESID
jgi:hypothetical protein